MTLQVGYAISRASYTQCKIDSSAEIKNEIILKNGLLDTASDYLVISCEEWDSITSAHSYDKEIPVGKINIKITININEITKEFSVSAGDILFDIVKIVMYTEKMTEDEFRDEFRYEITPDIQLNEKLVRAGTESVSINIFEKNKKNRKSKEDCMPVEFRNVGLTCYMNTALQVLLGVGELSNAIEEMTRDEINEYAQREDTKKGYTREKCGNLLNAYRELIKTVRKKKTATVS